MAEKRVKKPAPATTKPAAKARTNTAAKKPGAPAKANVSAKPMAATTKHRIFSVPFASVYPHYVAKVEKKGRSRVDLDRIIRWLTGYTQRALEKRLDDKTDFEAFFASAPGPDPLRFRVTGTICGVRVEMIDDPLMREIRILDKLVDELAQGRPMERILRKPAAE